MAETLVKPPDVDAVQGVAAQRTQTYHADRQASEQRATQKCAADGGFAKVSLFGFECGDGWFDLIDVLCEQLQSLTDHEGAPQVVAAQVKEKWGGLCFYPHGGANDEQWGMITMAEAMSVRICDQCGAPGALLASGRVHMTRCTLHAPAGAQPIETERHAGD